MAETVRQAIDATTVAMLRKRGSNKWTAAGPDGLGAAVAEMDFGAAPAILDALATLSADANFGYLSPVLADQLAEACAEFQRRRYHWTVDPALIHHIPDVIKGLELAITRFSRPGSPVILPTPAYMPFLTVPGFLGREIIQIRMINDDGFFTLDLDAIEDAFRAGGHLLIFCNPYNPLGRVFTREEIEALTDVVDRNGGRVFADEIHAPLVYPGPRHIPYASTSDTAAAHVLTATSASKAWNLPGLKCAQVILSSEPDRQRWEEMGFFGSRGASNPGVVANIAAYRHGEDWLEEVVGYLDDSRRLLADLLARQLPQVRYRAPDGTYLAWLDCTALDLPDSPGALITERAQVTVVDGPAFGDGGPGSFRLNFATPQPILTEMVDRIAAVLTTSPTPLSPHPHHPLPAPSGREPMKGTLYPEEPLQRDNHWFGEPPWVATCWGWRGLCEQCGEWGKDTTRRALGSRVHSGTRLLTGQSRQAELAIGRAQLRRGVVTAGGGDGEARSQRGAATARRGHSGGRRRRGAVTAGGGDGKARSQRRP